MLKNRNLIVGAAVLTSAVLALVGCASGSTEPAASSEGPDELVVGMDISYPPMEYFEGDQATGVDVDVANALAKAAGVPVRIENIGFDSLITSLQSGRIDVIISAMKDTKERQARLNIVDYFVTIEAIIVPFGNPDNVSDLQSLCGLKVGQVSGSVTLTEVETASAECEGDPIEVLPFGSNSEINLAIKSGQIDANLEDIASLSYVAQTSGGGEDFEVVPLDAMDTAQYFGIMTDKTDEEITDFVRDAYTEILDSGDLADIYEKWDLSSAVPSEFIENAGE